MRTAVDPITLLLIAGLVVGAFALSKGVKAAEDEPPPPDLETTAGSIGDPFAEAMTAGSMGQTGQAIGGALVAGAIVTASGGSQTEATAVAAGAAALLGAGPVGIVIGAGLAFADAHAGMMSEVAEFKDMRHMVTRAEYDRWRSLKSDTLTSMGSLEIWRHDKLHDYEVELTKKYRTEDEQLHWIDRAAKWTMGFAELSPWGDAFMLSLGYTKGISATALAPSPTRTFIPAAERVPPTYSTPTVPPQPGLAEKTLEEIQAEIVILWQTDPTDARNQMLILRDTGVITAQDYLDIKTILMTIPRGSLR